MGATRQLMIGNPDPGKYTPGNYVVTRWYRPPELLLGAHHYDTSVDIWGVGCIFGEMLARTVIMRGSDDVHQQHAVFKLCGTPTVENWPSFKSLPCFHSETGILDSFKTVYPRILRTKFPPNL